MLTNTRRRKRLTPKRLGVAPGPVRVYAIRNRNWVELRKATSPPRRRVSRAQVGSVKLFGYRWIGGDFIASVPAEMTTFKLPDSWDYIQLPRLEHGKMEVVSDYKMHALLLDEQKRVKLLGI